MRILSICFLGAFLLLTINGCYVSESDYEKVQAEKDALKKELADAEDENKVLNESIQEIYKEREILKSQLAKAKTELDEKLAAEAEKNKPKIYTVKGGDTLAKIAQENDVTIDDIRRLNNFGSNPSLYIGQKIKLR